MVVTTYLDQPKNVVLTHIVAEIVQGLEEYADGVQRNGMEGSAVQMHIIREDPAGLYDS